MNHIELSKRALKDVRRIDHANRRRLLNLLEQDLAAEPQPPNLDVKPLVGRTPWLRLRRGDYRILYRPLTDAELRTLRAGESAGLPRRAGHRPRRPRTRDRNAAVISTRRQSKGNPADPACARGLRQRLRAIQVRMAVHDGRPRRHGGHGSAPRSYQRPDRITRRSSPCRATDAKHHRGRRLPPSPPLIRERSPFIFKRFPTVA
jgi:mRNA-degrading endonuclease RelE of RelBE toxin-antitoxin system